MATMARAPAANRTLVGPFRKRYPYLFRAALWYLLFNAVIAPITLWIDIFNGWRYNHHTLLILPFVQGSLFFYVIVLNWDSIFRALHHAVVLKAPYSEPKVYALASCNVLAIGLAFADLLSRQEEIAYRIHDLTTTGSLPTAPVIPLVGDQLALLVATLLVGALMNHVVTEMEL